jgi:hypothetical protein
MLRSVFEPPGQTETRRGGFLQNLLPQWARPIEKVFGN